jgi:hypothetical protein
MIRTYTILSTNGELLTSPYVNSLQKTFDLVLTVHEPKVINFLFQFPISYIEAKRIHAIYDEDALELGDIHVERYSQQTLISTIITTKDIGSFGLGFAVPHQITTKKASKKKRKLVRN